MYDFIFSYMDIQSGLSHTTRKHFSQVLKNRDPFNRKSLKIMSLKIGMHLKLNILEPQSKTFKSSS